MAPMTSVWTVGKVDRVIPELQPFPAVSFKNQIEELQKVAALGGGGAEVRLTTAA